VKYWQHCAKSGVLYLYCVAENENVVEDHAEKNANVLVYFPGSVSADKERKFYNIDTSLMIFSRSSADTLLDFVLEPETGIEFGPP
jgi:hypothetical protein